MFEYDMSDVLETLRTRANESANRYRAVVHASDDIEKEVVNCIELFKQHLECYPVEFPNLYGEYSTRTYDTSVTVRFYRFCNDTSLPTDFVEYLLNEYRPERNTKLGDAVFDENLVFNYNGKSFDWVMSYFRKIGEVEFTFMVSFYSIPTPNDTYTTLIDLGKLVPETRSAPSLHLTC